MFLRITNINSVVCCGGKLSCEMFLHGAISHKQLYRSCFNPLYHSKFTPMKRPLILLVGCSPLSVILLIDSILYFRDGVPRALLMKIGSTSWAKSSVSHARRFRSMAHQNFSHPYHFLIKMFHSLHKSHCLQVSLI